MSDITRRGFFRLASVVGGAVFFNIKVKHPFAKLVAEKILQHPAARSVEASHFFCFPRDVVTFRIIYWSEKWQQRLIQLYEVPREVYESPGGEDSDLEAEIVAITLGRCADYQFKYGPLGPSLGKSPIADFVASEERRLISGTGSGGEPIGLL